MIPEPEAHGAPGVLECLERYLLNVGTAWTEADGEQRNKIARAVLNHIVIRDGHTVAVQPRPEFQPYLGLAQKKSDLLSTTLSTAGRGSGLEGIRTPGLGLDRAAC